MSHLVVPRQDYLALAQELPRARFVASFPFPFLLAQQALDTRERPSPTEVIPFGTLARPRRRTNAPTDVMLPALSLDDLPALPLLALAKTQEHFPSMITVGRTANNDVVIAEGTVSKFHAYFKPEDGRFALVDAGSRNGTFVGGERLKERAAGVDVGLGAVVRFGRAGFRVVDAGTAWDESRRAAAPASDW